jgi:hypothetical protein
MAPSFSSFVAASFLALANANGEDFVKKAERLFNAQDELVEMYQGHQVAHANNDKSELDALFMDMHQYVVDNEDSKGPKHILTIMTDDMGWVRLTPGSLLLLLLIDFITTVDLFQTRSCYFTIIHI